MNHSASSIRAALSSLRASGSVMFGADSHGFRLAPPLPEKDILAFEARHSIRLPDDYRNFVSQVGNGGAGPLYGIFPLGCIDDTNELLAWDGPANFIPKLTVPFPLTEAWNDLSEMPPLDLADRDQEEFDRLMERFEVAYWDPLLVRGSMPICHRGCALWILLIVNGPQAGTLWKDSRSEYSGLAPLLLKDGSPATFQAWYDEWLEGCLADLNC